MKNHYLLLFLLGAVSAGAECTEPSFVERFNQDRTVMLVGDSRTYMAGGACPANWIEMALTQEAKIVFCYDEDIFQSCGEDCRAYSILFCSLRSPVAIAGSGRLSPASGIEWESRADRLTLRIDRPGKYTGGLYDRLGREVWRVDGDGPGVFSLTRDRLPGGIYFLRLAGGAGVGAVLILP